MAFDGKSIAWFEGEWRDGGHPVIPVTDHAAWLGSQVFDGARWFDGVMPDLDLHCARLVRSAEAMGMKPSATAEELAALAREGVGMFDGNTALYIRPMMWARDGSASIVDPDPDSTAFALCIEEAPLLEEFSGYSLTVAPYRRPRQDMAMTEAKTGSLYPNNGRIMKWARDKGFDNALSLDIDDNVAETATTNIFAVRDGVVSTPEPTGCFLAGITRRRIIGLLRDSGVEVREEAMAVKDFEEADEIFTTGNAQKVVPVSRFQDRDMNVGKVALKARELYFEFAHDAGANG